MAVTISGSDGISGDLPTIKAGNGSASAPAVTGQDTDTGLFFGTNEIKVSTGGTAAVTVDSSQQVGIGTSNPQGLLDVKKDNATGEGATLAIRNTGTGVGTSVSLHLAPNNGGGDDIQRAASIKSRQTTSGNFADLGFFTANSDVPVERMRIDSSGAVRLSNPTASPALGSSTTGCQVSGGVLIVNSSGSGSVLGRNNNGAVLFFQRNGTSVGNISVSTTNTSYNTSSDYRLKENVIDLDGAIDRVKQLAPKRFNFIADADTTVDGFLAHEAQAVVPEAVTGTHDEVDENGNAVMQGIDQSKLVPLLTAALKEAVTKIETLETQNADLLTRVTTLEAAE